MTPTTAPAHDSDLHASMIARDVRAAAHAARAAHFGLTSPSLWQLERELARVGYRLAHEGEAPTETYHWHDSAGHHHIGVVAEER